METMIAKSTKPTESELVYGLKNDRVVHVSEVESGLNCDCVCPHCKTSLVAKKGDKKQHHFAHYDGENCSGASESALHKLAKQVIFDTKKLTVPLLLLPSSDSLANNLDLKDLTFSSQLLSFDIVELEVDSGNYRPDVLAAVNGELLEIEILVTHEVDATKALLAREAAKKMIEIDLSELAYDTDIETLRNEVLYQAKRRWISNSEIEGAIRAIGPNNKNQEADNVKTERLLSDYMRTSCLNDYHNNHARVVFGFKAGKGFSQRYNSHFELSKLYVAKPVQTRNTKNFDISASSGYEIEEMEFEDNCLEHLKAIDFPCALNLEMGQRLQGRRYIPVVIGVSE